tara:strand:- start:2131 stop:2844 length:714 start_codon:yes stop_codon:yes gene_type:complete
MRLFGLITVALVAIAVIAITPVLSQNMNEPTVTKGQSGMGEGIKVHGDWKVKVTDPETGVEKVYAFRNKLTEFGGRILMAALAPSSGIPGTQGYVKQVYHPDRWKVAFFDSEGNLVCTSGKFDENKNTQYVQSVPLYPESLEGLLPSNADLGGPGLSIRGACDAFEDSQVSQIKTFAQIHSSWEFEDGIGLKIIETKEAGLMNMYRTDYSFTEKILESPFAVKEGQMIGATVNITFE